MQSRRSLNLKPAVNLTEVIAAYYENKRQAASYDAKAKDGNSTIKEEMSRLELSEFIAGDIIATLTTTIGESFDEQKALEILKENLTEEQKMEVIKTTEYLDSDALERLIYAKQFDASLLAPCNTKNKPITTLRIGKAK